MTIKKHANTPNITTGKDEYEPGGCLSDTEWQQICEKGRLYCKYCGYPPPIDDVAVFLEEGTCGRCKGAWEKFMAD
jgi:hypothetical protein